jgi:hypothetical protein
MLSLFEQMAGTRGSVLLQEHLRVPTKRSNKKRPLTRPLPPRRVLIFQARLVVAKAIALLSLYLQSSWRPCL